jgi:S1-C subfamily serine protease
MARIILFFVSMLLCIPPSWAQTQSAPPVVDTPTNLMRALPGVYRILKSGKGQFRVPKAIRVKWGELAADAEAQKNSSDTGKNLSATFHQWRALETNPEKYLEASDEVNVFSFSEGYGSGFAISREGVLLTNRHVVEEFDNAPMQAEDVMKVASKDVLALCTELAEKLGEDGVEPYFVKQSMTKVVKWIGVQSRKTFRRERLAVVVAYANPTTRASDSASVAASLFGVSTELREPIVAPASVVALGGPGIAEDVAILKIDADVHDALICLPLAKPEAIKLNDPIHSLGFPAFRYEKEKMSSLQYYNVNIESGKIDYLPASGEAKFRELSRLHPKGLKLADRSMLAVTALIRPGSSGGPVILENGSVIGLNVAYRDLPADEQDDISLFGKKKQVWLTKPLNSVDRPAPTSVNFTVPVDVAIRLLEKHTIEPNVGDTTRQWLEAMKLYEAGDKRAAKLKFQEVASRQKARLAEKPTARSALPVSIVSHYVTEMIERCDAAAK